MTPELTRDDGVQIHWEERGKGPLVVLSAHTLAYPEALEELISDLATDHRLTTYDARGTGSSSRRGPYDVATDRADLEALIEELGEPAVALAWGGETGHRAILLAAGRPELVPAVVLVGGGGGIVRLEEAADTDALGGSEAVGAAITEMLRTDYRAALRSLVSSTSTQLTEDEVRDRVERGVTYCPQEAAVARFRDWDPTDEVVAAAGRLGERLWVVQFPTIWFPKETIGMVRERLPRAHVIGLGDHDGPLSQPAITAGVVRAATAPLRGARG